VPERIRYICDTFATVHGLESLAALVQGEARAAYLLPLAWSSVGTCHSNSVVQGLSMHVVAVVLCAVQVS
jgi:hypothetical protein